MECGIGFALSAALHRAITPTWPREQLKAELEFERQRSGSEFGEGYDSSRCEAVVRRTSASGWLQPFADGLAAGSCRPHQRHSRR